MEPQNPKISIIVPIYNVERYLSKCLDSILAQRFTDFELLLVDDGSSDGSGEICDRYSALDSRIRLFHRENRGVSSARNMALDSVRGEWIAFCDSDDWVDEGYLSTFVEDLNRGEYQLYCYSWTSHYQTDNRIAKNNIIANHDSDNITLPALDCYTQLYNANSYGFLWMKLFKASIIGQYNIRFDVDVSYQEDVLFTNEYLRYVDSAFLSTESFYNYRRERGASLATNVLTKYSYQTLRAMAHSILLSSAPLFAGDSSRINQAALRVCVDKYLADINGCCMAFYRVHNLSSLQTLRRCIVEDILLLRSTIPFDELGGRFRMSKKMMIHAPFIYGVLLYIYLKTRLN